MGGFLLSSTTNAIGIHPAAGCSTGRDIPEEAEEHQQETAGCSCSTGRNMSARGSRMLHRQEYIRKRQQDAPRAGICPQEAAGCSIGRNISGGGRGTSTGDSGMLLLHGQEYVRKRQQDAP